MAISDVKVDKNIPTTSKMRPELLIFAPILFTSRSKTFNILFFQSVLKSAVFTEVILQSSLF